jgi:hypothetical protein
MDYLLLLIGLVMMYKRRMSWLFAIIILLASSYLQLPLKTEMQLMVGPAHNVADTGLLLYLLFFLREVFYKGIYLRNPLQKTIALFIIFLLINGFYDIINGVSVGDVIRYLKNWAFLSIVFISVDMTRDDVLGTVKIIFWITFGLCLLIVIQHIAGMVWLGNAIVYVSDGIVYSRGVKPPSYAIICGTIAILNILGLSRTTQMVTSFVFMLSVLLNMKMSYFATIAIILSVYFLLDKGIYIAKVIRYVITGFVCFAVVFTVFPVFHQRFDETVQQSGIIFSDEHNKEGNFSYRIEHFAERFEYVTENPVRAIRGLGYVQERNFHQNIFKLGQESHLGEKAQLDTGDIAWSILIIRLGIAGILCFTYFYFKCMGALYRRRKESNVDMLFFSYMFTSFFVMSFGNTLIANSEFYILPLLICMTQNHDIPVDKKYKLYE